ncbi:MAG: 5-(carboxyamino)imidazole ribonucleotide synthase [Phycisphaeraceae bacterium]|nr:5-(carboxyamino)imidazole ribonucleotide synthase [Phycisphaeraceae bacterium]
MTIGVLGGGQLGRMLALAGTPLGFRFRFLDPDAGCPASAVGEVIAGAYDDPQALDRFAKGVDLVTFEFENVPAETVRRLSSRVAIAPGAESLATGQDRAHEKRFFAQCGLPVAPWAEVHDAASLMAAVDSVGVPAVLKARRLGYDGKGQCVIKRREDAPSAFDALGRVPCTLEAFVPFSRELSVIAVRGRDGSFLHWPISENVHRHGILHTTLAPAEVEPAMERAIAEYARTVMHSLDHVGVLAIEFFDDHGRLLVNEMAPRVHNSGHWTIDGAVTSQFENHLRAIAGLPLGSTAPRGVSAMLNLIGSTPPLEALASESDLKIHLYAKAPRAGRKVGHLTTVAPSREVARERLRRLEGRFAPESIAAAASSA